MRPAPGKRYLSRLPLSLVVLLLPAVASAQAKPVHVEIDASKTSAPISKYIYGQFLEHGGNIVNEGVWAEMLEDRKFYNPISLGPVPGTIAVPPFSLNIYSYAVQ